MANDKVFLFGMTSILSYMLANNKKGRQNNQLRLPSFPGVLEVKSAIKGRIRFYIPLLRNNADLAERISSQLQNISLIKEVTISPVTASLLIEYEWDKIEPHVLEGAVIKLFGLDEHIDQKQISFVEREIHTMTAAVNQAVLEKTSGFMDAKYMVAAGFIVMGILKIVQGSAASLNPFNLLWWGSNIVFKGGRP